MYAHVNKALLRYIDEGEGIIKLLRPVAVPEPICLALMCLFKCRNFNGLWHSWGVIEPLFAFFDENLKISEKSPKIWNFFSSQLWVTNQVWRIFRMWYSSWCDIGKFEFFLLVSNCKSNWKNKAECAMRFIASYPTIIKL